MTFEFYDADKASAITISGIKTIEEILHMNSILTSPFNMGPIVKDQILKITGEFPSGYTFESVAGVWSKELFNLPVEAEVVHDGNHNYYIPISLYEEHLSFIQHFDEDNYEDCNKWEELFRKYRVNGITKIYVDA